MKCYTGPNEAGQNIHREAGGTVQPGFEPGASPTIPLYFTGSLERIVPYGWDLTV
jgi:hypothetical protein